MHLSANEFSIGLPTWVPAFMSDQPEAIPDQADRMALVCDLADRNWREGNGGPFAAMVAEVDTGLITSVGVNVVLSTGMSMAHAEVTAIGLAQASTGTWDLAAAGQPRREILVNWRPCVQCYGAVMWSGLRSLVIAGSGPEVEDLTTFDEGPMREDWAAQFEDRGIQVTDGLLRDKSLKTFVGYRDAVAAGDVVVYNPGAS